MGTGYMPQGGNPGAAGMKTPNPATGLTPASPWSGAMPWQSAGYPAQQGASDGGIIGGSQWQKPAWRQQAAPFGVLMPAMLPGMMQQQAQTQPVAPTGTVSGGTGTYVTPAPAVAAAAAAPEQPKSPLADFWAAFNYGSSGV